MNSDKQVKVEGGSALSYHAFVERLVKKFPLLSNFSRPRFTDTGEVAMPVKDYRKIEIEFDKMAYKLELCHLAIGLATEGSEAADVIKQHAIYGKEFDRAALVKELGDLRFWIQDAQNKFHISDHEIAQGNADKLGERYKKLSYSDKDAIQRVDKRFVVARTPQEAKMRQFISGPWEHMYEAEKVAVPGDIILCLDSTSAAADVYLFREMDGMWVKTGGIIFGDNKG